MKRTKAFLSPGNLTLFSCEFFNEKFYCIVIQHGRLVTWFQTKKSQSRYVDLAKANSEVLVYTLKQKINLKPLRRNLLNLCLILVRSQTCKETEPFQHKNVKRVKCYRVQKQKKSHCKQNCIYQKSKGLISKKKTLHVHHVLLFISLSLLLHDYNVKLDKIPN